MLAIALELAQEDHAYEDVASKFWEHFIYIASAMSHLGNDSIGLWDEAGRLLLRRAAAARRQPLPHESALDGGIDPLFAVETLEQDVLERMPGFKRRMEWFIENRPDLTANVAA